MIKRKYISSATRQLVYNKYNGHCAYCGCELRYKDMQVDHFVSFRNLKYNKRTEEEIENIDNYMPTCRLCNWAKRSKSIDHFRRYLQKILDKISNTAAYRLAIKYNLIEEKPHKIVFYFEKEDK